MLRRPLLLGATGNRKALKAVLVARKIPYPYTQDINALLAVLEQNDISFPEKLWSDVTLTTYASDTRYPGFDKPVTKDEYDDAIILAHMVLHWAEGQIE